MKFDGVFPTCLLIPLLVSGCAELPSYDEYARTLQPMTNADGRIFFYRLTTEGASIRPAVRIDGEPVGRTIPGGFFTVDLPAGDYVISASTKGKPALPLRVRLGEELYVRLDVQILVASWQVTPVLVPRSEGTEEIRRTSYSGQTVAATE